MLLLRAIEAVMGSGVTSDFAESIAARKVVGIAAVIR